jgi:proteasome lid subunit RPN8/RPN11
MLKIPRNIVDDIFEHGQNEAPLEACGILAGSEGCVETLYRMTNIDKSREHFSMKPEEQFRVAKDIRGKGQKMLAIYHTHPESEAFPSDEDIRLGLMPDVIHIIASLVCPEDKDIKGFFIDDGETEQVSLEITG